VNVPASKLIQHKRRRNTYFKSKKAFACSSGLLTSWCAITLQHFLRYFRNINCKTPLTDETMKPLVEQKLIFTVLNA